MHKIFLIIPHHHDKKKLLCEFNKIHRRHATYCSIKMIQNTNREMLKGFFSLGFLIKIISYFSQMYKKLLYIQLNY